MSDLYEVDPLMVEQTIEDWVITKCEDWRDHYELTTLTALTNTTDYGVVYGTLLTATELLNALVLFPLRYNRLWSLM